VKPAAAHVDLCQAKLNTAAMVKQVPCGSQGLNLLTGGDHFQVSFVQFMEIANQVVGIVEGLRRVQHEVAQEHVDIAEVLCRLCLVQQSQCTFTFDSEQSAEAFLIGRKFLTDEGILKGSLQGTHLEVARQERVLEFQKVELAFEHHVLMLDIALLRGAATNPQHHRQRYRLTFHVSVGCSQCSERGVRAQKFLH
jgi:hypothetical protein